MSLTACAEPQATLSFLLNNRAPVFLDRLAIQVLTRLKDTFESDNKYLASDNARLQHLLNEAISQRNKAWAQLEDAVRNAERSDAEKDEGSDGQRSNGRSRKSLNKLVSGLSPRRRASRVSQGGSLGWRGFGKQIEDRTVLNCVSSLFRLPACGAALLLLRRRRCSRVAATTHRRQFPRMALRLSGACDCVCVREGGMTREAAILFLCHTFIAQALLLLRVHRHLQEATARTPEYAPRSGRSQVRGRPVLGTFCAGQAHVLCRAGAHFAFCAGQARLRP